MSELEIEVKHIAEALLKKEVFVDYSGAVCAEFVMLMARKVGRVDVELKDVVKVLCEGGVPAELAGEVEKILRRTSDGWRRYITAFSPEALDAFIFDPTYEGETEGRFGVPTPASVAILVRGLLDVKKDDAFAELCCGTGLFSTSVGLEVPEIKSIDAIELNQEALTIARIRAYLIDLGGKMKVHGGDVFDLCDDKASYEKIFCHPPWGLRLKGNAPVESFLSRLPVSLPQMKNSISSDWFFALRALYSLKDGGRAVVIMTNSAVWNQPDADIRKFLLERHFVEAVVSLPSKIYQWTAIPTTLVVLSKKDNTSVKLFDATKMCVEGRRMNELSDENIRDILMTVHDEMPMACPAFPVEELISRESILNPLFYTGDDFTEKDMPNAVEFGTVMKSVTRGATINATELDRLESNAPTNFQYLMLSNIQNGMIDSELPYLKDVERKLLPYCIKDGDLIVSKMGRPFKVAVAKVAFGKTLLGNGSLFIIEVDKEKADPYYLQAFFESERGTALLQRFCLASVMPSISLGRLKEIKIPLPPLAEQKKIADRFRAKIDEVALYRVKLERAINSLREVYDQTVTEG